MFPSPPIIAYKRAKNLKDCLIKADFRGVSRKDSNSLNTATLSELDHEMIELLESLESDL